jgi:hydrogenase expression/formation protein HypC
MCLAIPGRIQERFEAAGLPMGRVEFGGVCRDVCLAYVPDARVGQYVVVHVGFALSVLDAEEAARTLRMLDELVEPSDPGEGGAP